MIRTAFSALLFVVLVSPAQSDEFTVLPEKIDSVAPKQMMHAHLMRRAEEAFDRRDAEYEKLTTADQIAAYQKRSRQFFIDQLGGLPERTPPRAQVVAKEDRDGYRIEKVIYESRPNHFVTAVLYLPDAKPPYPGVLVPCGHSNNGKASETYQRVSILLAKMGMAAFCYDPIDQGERFQLLDADGKPQTGGTTAHSLIGVGSTLLGCNTASFRVWDGIRGIDYLAARPEVDPKRIGCTGNSGGGTLTSYLMALDERIVCAAPSCYLTTMRRLCETIGPQDGEQNIFGQIRFGMDHTDYVMMRAPKPTLICSATHDFFDISGTWTNFRQAKRLYTRLNFAERVDLIETDAKHGFSTQLRVGAVRWMRRWLMDLDDAITEPESAIVSDAEMQCTPSGQVMLLDGARSTFDLNIEQQRELAADRADYWKKTDTAEALDEVRRITGIRRLADLPDLKCERVDSVEHETYRLDRLILRPEQGICLPALALVPKKRNGEAVLHLQPEGKHVDAAEGGPIRRLVDQRNLVLAVDLRGCGETAGGSASTRGIPYYIGPDWKNQYLAYLLGTSYLAMRAEDILTCSRFLAEYETDGEKPNQVHVWAIGRCGPPALHAAVLEPKLIGKLTLHRCLDSWASVVETPLAVRQFENVVHGALRTYDLNDLLGTLPKSKVAVREPVDALDQPIGK